MTFSPGDIVLSPRGIGTPHKLVGIVQRESRRDGFWAVRFWVPEDREWTRELQMVKSELEYVVSVEGL